MNKTLAEYLLAASPYFTLVLGIMVLPAVAVALWSLRWPSVKGRVDISIYDPHDDPGNGGLSLSYSYAVAGRSFAGEKIRPLGFEWFGSRGRYAQRYTEGTVVDVYYCPIFPDVSCLIPGAYIGIFLWPLVWAARLCGRWGIWRIFE